MKTFHYAMIAATALSASLLSGPAMADAETEALRAQIKLLEARLDAMEKKQAITLKTAAKAEAAASLAPAAGKKVKPSAPIEQRLAVVERNQELAQEDALAKAKTQPKIDYGYKGFGITSADNQYSIRMRAYIQADNRTYFNNSNNTSKSTFLIRAARPIWDAKMTDYFNARLMLDFGQGNPRTLDAYGEFHPLAGSSDLVNLRFGMMKVPVGIERWQSEQEILFTERGMSTNLAPFRDIGAALYGQIIPDQLEYFVGIVNGATDLQVNNSDADNRKDFAGRIFAKPLTWSGVSWLEGIGLGLAGTYGKHNGNATTPNLTAGYQTTGQRTFFGYTPTSGTVFANGTNWRLNPQALYYNGPLGVIGEYILESQELGKTTANTRTLKNDAWTAIATYVLTGEDASFDGLKVGKPFNPKTGDWGAFELVSRYSQLTADRDTFPTFANVATSARKAQEAVIGGTWYMNNSVKVNLDYSFDWFDGGKANGFDRENERVLMTRAQFRF